MEQSKGSKPPSETDVDSIIAELSEHPFFADRIDDDATELPPFIEAIRQIKWDEEEEDSNSRAEKFKRDGNFDVKLRKYRRAIIAYTVGIELRPTNESLLAQLHHNRAVANIQLGNLGTAVKDLKAAINISKEYLKAYQKAAVCLNRLGRFDECKQVCMDGLRYFKNDKNLVSSLETAKREKELAEQRKRKEKQERSELEQKAASLRETIKGLGIQVRLRSNEELFELVDFNGSELLWRMCFIEMDTGHSHLILRTPSSSTFRERLCYLFEEGSDLPADAAQHMKIVGKSAEGGTIELDWDQTLLGFLTDKRVVIDSPVLEFLLIPEASRNRTLQ